MSDLPTQVDEVLQKFNKGIKSILGKRIKKVILYGSYARGDYNKNSDIDIMILTDLTDDEIIKYRNQILDYAYELEWNNNFDITISPLIKNIDNFNYWVEALPFYMNVEKEGVILN